MDDEYASAETFIGWICPECLAGGAKSRFESQDELVAHREAEHFGEPKTLAVSGIVTQEKHGFQEA